MPHRPRQRIVWLAVCHKELDARVKALRRQRTLPRMRELLVIELLVEGRVFLDALPLADRTPVTAHFVVVHTHSVVGVRSMSTPAAQGAGGDVAFGTCIYPTPKQGERCFAPLA